jgi:tRNA-dihydrouridine synthase
MPVIERYLQLAEHFLPLDKVLFKVKNHTAKFLTGISGASSLRHALYACEDISEVRTLLCRQAVHGTVEPSLPT